MLWLRWLLQQCSAFAAGLGFIGWDNGGAGYLVVGVEVEEFDAGGVAAGTADGFGVDADDLAKLADHHQLAGLVYKIDSSDFTDLRRRLHVDDTLAAAGLEAVGVDVGALAVAVLGDGEDEAGGEAELLVELLQLGGGFGAELGCGGGIVGFGEGERLRGGGVGGFVDGCSFLRQL